MKEELITFETAKLAKEKGFEQSKWDMAYSENNPLEPITEAMHIRKGQRYSAPTQSLLQRWLREEHEIELYVKIDAILDSRKYSFVTFNCKNLDVLHLPLHNYVFDTYELALEKGLFEALKLIKK